MTEETQHDPLPDDEEQQANEAVVEVEDEPDADLETDDDEEIEEDEK